MILYFTQHLVHGVVNGVVIGVSQKLEQRRSVRYGISPHHPKGFVKNLALHWLYLLIHLFAPDMIHDLTLETIRNMTTDLMTDLIPDMIVNLFHEPTLDLIKDLTPDLMIDMKPVHLFTHDLIPYLISDPLRDGIKDLMVDPAPDLILGIIHQRSLDLTPRMMPDLLHDLFFMTFHFAA